MVSTILEDLKREHKIAEKLGNWKEVIRIVKLIEKEEEKRDG